MRSTLVLRSALALGGLTIVLSVVDGFVLTQALSSASTVRQYRSHTAALERDAAKIRSDFYAYDGANNMYVLVAATGGAAGHDLWTATFAQAQQTARQLDGELGAVDALVAGTRLAPVLGQLRTDLNGYNRLFADGYRQVLAGEYPAAADSITVRNNDVSTSISKDLDAVQASVVRESAARLTALQGKQGALVKVAEGALGLTVLLLAGLGLALYRSVLVPIGLLRHQMPASTATLRLGWTYDARTSSARWPGPSTASWPICRTS